MTLNPQAVGLTSKPRVHSWTDKDTLLYALGIGAGIGELAFTTENSHGLPQQVYPTFGVVVAGEVSLLREVGQFDKGKMVHGSQGVRVHGPLPPVGSLRVTTAVAEMQDKGEGKNAVLVLTGRGEEPESGEVLVETRTTLVIRGAGGFGGSPGEKPQPPAVPGREPDLKVQVPTRRDQPLVYRLSGDRNPLHSDPWFAKNRAGFPEPILHGLCTYGIAGRVLMHGLLDGDTTRFAAFDARFAAPVIPGENLRVSAWQIQPGAVTFLVEAEDSEGQRRTVLDQGLLEHR